MAKSGLKGMDAFNKKLKTMQDRKALQPLSEYATAMAAKHVRDEIKAKVHIASGPWTVYYGSKGKGNRKKYTFPAGTVAAAIIMKNIPDMERGGLLAKHIVTIRQSGDWAPVARAAIMMEHGVMTGGSNAFFRNTFEAEKGKAMQAMDEVMDAGIQKLWDKS